MASGRQHKVIAIGALCAALACGSVAAPETGVPVAEQAGVGILVEVQPMLGGSYAAETVYFARLGNDDQPDLSTLYVSNFRRGNRVYLLNVAPGRYAALAAVFRVGFIGPKSSYVTYFPGSVIGKSAVEGVARRVSFAGRYLMDTGIGVCADKADPLQARAAEAISPGAAKCGVVGMVAQEMTNKPVVVVGGSAFALGPSTYHYRGIERTASNDAAERGAFATHVQEDLAAAGWTAQAP